MFLSGSHVNIREKSFVFLVRGEGGGGMEWVEGRKNLPQICQSFMFLTRPALRRNYFRLPQVRCLNSPGVIRAQNT
jgi:hypothetical protein